MNLSGIERSGPNEWTIPPGGNMLVPGILYATEPLLVACDEKVREQVCNVAMLPGIVKASFAMPDAHWGYGFPIGGVAAFDAADGGVVSAGGVGFDISCGVRLLRTGLSVDDVNARKTELAERLFATIPAGVGSRGKLHLEPDALDAMLAGGARWAVEQGYGVAADLERIEERGCMAGADPQHVSARARKRQCDEMGTLGSGNHYLEVQKVVRIDDAALAQAFGLQAGDVVLSIHCGSRGLGHQIGTEFLKIMAVQAPQHGITLPDRELACAPIRSDLGRAYLGAMRAAINCALANRQILTHLVRQVFDGLFPSAQLDLVYDVSHNTCKEETHEIDGRMRRLFVHRKGATRAFGPGEASLPGALRAAGQPVVIGGSMGTASYVMGGTSKGMSLAFGSACHGAGRTMSRHQATRLWNGREVIRHLAGQGILVRSQSYRGVAEEAPGAYKDVAEVVEAADGAGLARSVVRLEPMVCIKG